MAVTGMPLIVKKQGDVILNAKTGSVGIGTASPQAKLDVNGNVRIGNVPVPSGYKLYVEDGILSEKVKNILWLCPIWFRMR